MRTKLSIFAVAIGMFLAAAPVWGHHFLIVNFDVTKPVALRGTLTKMEWVNPHGWIHMDVKSPDGKVENWRIETGAPNRIVAGGLKRTDFVPGIEIIVDGLRAKNGTPTAAGLSITFPDRQLSFPLGR